MKRLQTSIAVMSRTVARPRTVQKSSFCCSTACLFPPVPCEHCGGLQHKLALASLSRPNKRNWQLNSCSCLFRGNSRSGSCSLGIHGRASASWVSTVPATTADGQLQSVQLLHRWCHDVVAEYTAPCVTCACSCLAVPASHRVLQKYCAVVYMARAQQAACYVVVSRF